MATCDLLCNVPILTREELSCAIGFVELVIAGADSELRGRPPKPALASPMYSFGKVSSIYAGGIPAAGGEEKVSAT